MTYDTINALIPKRLDPLTPLVPTEAIIAAMRKHFSGHPAAIAQGLMSVCYLIANILPECVWGSGEDSRRGVRVDVKVMVEIL